VWWGENRKGCSISAEEPWKYWPWPLSPFLAWPRVGKFSTSYPSHYPITINPSPSYLPPYFVIPISFIFAILIYSDFYDFYANLRYVLTGEDNGRTGVVRSHYVLAFLDSGISHCLLLGRFRPRIIVLYLWIQHGRPVHQNSGILRANLQSGYYLEVSNGDSFRFLWLHDFAPGAYNSWQSYWFGGPKAPLASLSEGRDLVICEPNQVWVLLHPDA